MGIVECPINNRLCRVIQTRNDSPVNRYDYPHDANLVPKGLKWMLDGDCSKPQYNLHEYFPLLQLQHSPLAESIEVLKEQGYQVKIPDEVKSVKLSCADTNYCLPILNGIHPKHISVAIEFLLTKTVESIKTGCPLPIVCFQDINFDLPGMVTLTTGASSHFFQHSPRYSLDKEADKYYADSLPKLEDGVLTGGMAFEPVPLYSWRWKEKKKRWLSEHANKEHVLIIRTSNKIKSGPYNTVIWK